MSLCEEYRPVTTGDINDLKQVFASLSRAVSPLDARYLQKYNEYIQSFATPLTVNFKQNQFNRMADRMSGIYNNPILKYLKDLELQKVHTDVQNLGVFTKQTNFNENAILRKIPFKRSCNTKQLLTNLKDYLTWNNLGEISVLDIHVPGSNITNLLYYLQTRSKQRRNLNKPEGLNSFYELILSTENEDLVYPPDEKFENDLYHMYMNTRRTRGKGKGKKQFREHVEENVDKVLHKQGLKRKRNSIEMQAKRYKSSFI